MLALQFVQDQINGREYVSNIHQETETFMPSFY